jgi:hypothetical protein
MQGITLSLIIVAFATSVSQAHAGDKGTSVELGGLKSVTPASWKAKEISPKLGKFRIYQFALPKADGDKEDAELAVFFFSGGGGGNDANIKRWKAMMAAPPGKSIDDVTKISDVKVGDVKVTYVDISGTYLYKFPPFDPNAKVMPKENFRFIGIIFDNEKGPYFMRVTGPARTVEANKKGFDEWIKAFK